MTKEEFLKVTDFFKDEDVFVCAAYVDGAPATAVQGPTEAVIVAALHAIVDAAEHSDNKMKHLVSASYILHGVMLSEMGEKQKEEPKCQASGNGLFAARQVRRQLDKMEEKK